VAQYKRPFSLYAKGLPTSSSFVDSLGAPTRAASPRGNVALVMTTGILEKTWEDIISLTSRGAEGIAGRAPPLTQTTSSVPADRQVPSSSRQRSTPRRARKQRWAPS